MNSKYSPEDVQGFTNRVNNQIPAKGDTVTAGDYPPLAPEAPSTAIAYPVTPFGDMATTDALSDVTNVQIAPEVMAAVSATYGGPEE